MHPMMGLAALHGLVALRCGGVGWRLAQHRVPGARAIRISADDDKRVTQGRLGYPNLYTQVGLDALPDWCWDGVTPELIEGIICTQ